MFVFIPDPNLDTNIVSDKIFKGFHQIFNTSLVNTIFTAQGSTTHDQTQIQLLLGSLQNILSRVQIKPDGLIDFVGRTFL